MPTRSPMPPRKQTKFSDSIEAIVYYARKLFRSSHMVQHEVTGKAV